MQKDHRGGQKELIQIFVAMFSGSGLGLVTYLHVCLPGWWVCWGCPCAGKNTPLWPPRSHWLSANRRQLALPRQQVVLRTVYPHVGVRVRIHVDPEKKGPEMRLLLNSWKMQRETSTIQGRVSVRFFKCVLIRHCFKTSIIYNVWLSPGPGEKNGTTQDKQSIGLIYKLIGMFSYCLQKKYNGIIDYKLLYWWAAAL